MFWKKKKIEERGVAFQLGEAVEKYTDMVIDQLKVKQDEIDRLTAIINATNKSNE